MIKLAYSQPVEINPSPYIFKIMSISSKRVQILKACEHVAVILVSCPLPKQSSQCYDVGKLYILYSQATFLHSGQTAQVAQVI